MCTRNERIGSLYIKEKIKVVSKMKRKLGVLITIVLLIFIPTRDLEAKGVGNIIHPCYEYTDDIGAELSISANGIANIKAKCVSSVGDIEKIYLHVYLQKYVNEEWKNVQYWPATSQTRTCTLNKSMEVVHGYSYRVKVSAYVMTTDDS